MRTRRWNRVITTLFITLLVAVTPLLLPPLTGLQRPASAQTTCYLPIISKSWPPVPAACILWTIDNADGDGNYTVIWSAAARAEDYELQEMREGQDWFTAYLGAGTSANLNNRPAGTYTYRCRGRNSWGEGVWGNEVAAVVQGTAPGTYSRPSCSSTSAGGQAVVNVINDCPYILSLDFAGPQPAAMQLPKCTVCKVYSIIGPFSCPTSNRPIQDQYLVPGNYRLFVTVDNPSVRPYMGLWSLSGDCRYRVCFYIVSSFSAEAGMQRQLVPGACD